jgi:hypothetical protein
MLTMTHPAVKLRTAVEMRGQAAAYHKTLVRSGYQPGETR